MSRKGLKGRSRQAGGTMANDIDALIEIIEGIAKGDYSDRIMAYSLPGRSEDVRRLAEAVGLMMVGIEAREFRLTRLLEDLGEANAKIKRGVVGAVAAMSRAINARHAETRGHSARVAVYAERLGRRIGVTGEDLEILRFAGLLHDIGKIGFDDDIFHNETSVPRPEMLSRIREHPAIGADILESLDFLGPIREYVLCHHERPDGKGYPCGLPDEDIPLGAKIVSVADVFDALTTDRCYQKGKTTAEALAILNKLAGTGLDAQLVEAFTLEIKENGRIGEKLGGAIPTAG